MTSIVYEDKASGKKYLYQPSYPAQRTFFEQNRNERIISGLKELRHVANINIYLFKHNRLRKIAEHGM